MKRFIVSIIVVFVGPPLQTDHDWEAFYGEDELDEDRHRGYGRTIGDAIADLTTRYRWEP